MLFRSGEHRADRDADGGPEPCNWLSVVSAVGHAVQRDADGSLRGLHSEAAVSVTVTVNGQSGPTISAKTGDKVGVTVGGSGSYAVSVSPAGTPGGQGPQGPQGAPATTIKVGTVSGLASDKSPTVTSSSSDGGATVTLSFGIPAGAQGAQGPAGPTGPAGPSFTLPTASDTVLGGIKVGANLTITDGVLAATASGSGVSLSSATPSALGTAAAGSSNLASRADHVHKLQIGRAHV